ncbi:MAG: hypothetical protein Q9226_003524 [Calogaya cf. arnoldii]
MGQPSSQPSFFKVIREACNHCMSASDVRWDDAHEQDSEREATRDAVAAKSKIEQRELELKLQQAEQAKRSNPSASSKAKKYVIHRNKIVEDITPGVMDIIRFHSHSTTYDDSAVSPWAKWTAIALACAPVCHGIDQWLEGNSLHPIKTTIFVAAAVVVFVCNESHYKNYNPPAVINPLAMIRYPSGVFPLAFRRVLVLRFPAGAPLSLQVLYSLREATPLSLRGRVLYYGPHIVLPTSYHHTPGACSSQFILLKSQRRITWEPRRLITWHYPVPPSDRILGKITRRAPAYVNAGTQIEPTSSYAEASTQTHSNMGTVGNSFTKRMISTATSIEEPVHKPLFLPVKTTLSTRDVLGHLKRDHTNLGLSMSAIKTVVDTPDTQENNVTASQGHCFEISSSDLGTAASIDQSQVNALLALVTELEGVVAQQKTQIEEQAASTINNRGQNTSDDKVWANRSTMLVEEVDVDAWAEAALISKANTIADKNRLVMQQQAKIVSTERRQRVIEGQQLLIKQHEDTESVRRARRLRYTFKSASSASKEAVSAKQLQEELQTEKAGHEADAQKAQESIDKIKAEAAEALAALKREHAEEIKKLTSELKTANDRHEDIASRLQEAEQGLNAQKQECHSEKGQLRSTAHKTAQQLATANAKVKTLEREVEKKLEAKDRLHQTAFNEYKDQAAKQEQENNDLKAENERLKAEMQTRNKQANMATKEKVEQVKNYYKQKQREASKTTNLKDSKIQQLTAENSVLATTIAARTTHQDRDACTNAEHSAAVKSLQEEVSSKDQRIRDLEKELENLRRQGTTNAVATASSPAPTLTSLLDTPSSPNFSGFTPLVPVTTPSRPSPAQSHVSFHSVTPHTPSPTLPEASAASRHSALDSRSLPPLQEPEDSLVDISLPSYNSDDYRSSLGVVPSSPPAEPVSDHEPEVAYRNGLEELLDHSLHTFCEDDVIDVAHFTDQVDFLTTTAAAGQRLITWPYSIPSLSITWRDGSDAEALPSSTGHVLVLTDEIQPGAASPSVSAGKDSSEGDKDIEKFSAANQKQTKEEDKRAGDLSQNESSSTLQAATILSVAARHEVASPTPTPPAEELPKDPAPSDPIEVLTSLFATLAPANPRAPHADVEPVVSIAVDSVTSKDVESDITNDVESVKSKGKSKEVITHPSAGEAPSTPPPPPQPIPAVATLPQLAQPISSDKTAEVTIDKSDQLKGQAPRETSSDGGKEKTSSQSADQENSILTNSDETLPGAAPLEQLGHHPKPKIKLFLRQPAAAASSNSSSSDPADGTLPDAPEAAAQPAFQDRDTLPDAPLVQNDSSKGKQHEDANDDGDEPIGEAVAFLPIPSSTPSEHLIPSQPREDGDCEMGDAAPQSATQPFVFLEDVDQPFGFADVTPGL